MPGIAARLPLRLALGWKTPLAVYAEHMNRLQLQADSVH
jgi:transposase, IS30 family